MKNLLIIFLFFASLMQAQDGKHEKIKALKTAYITEKLALTPVEAEKFWPIYNRYDEKLHDLRKREKCEIYHKLKEDLENLNEAEANAMIAESLSLEDEELELRKKRISELRNAITPKKIIILKKAENDFKRELLDRYKNSKGDTKTKKY